jgi:protein O-GlcNAc transferase
MTKDNILFSVIGLLLGVIVGYVFANTVNQRGYTPPQRTSASRSAEQSGDLPENHPPIAGNGSADQSAQASADATVLERAQSEPDNFDLQMQAAAIQYQNKRYDEAIQLLTRANQLRPDNYETVVRLGDANFDAGRYEVAEKWYTAALQKNPKDVNVRTDLGLSFMFREPPDYDRAIKEFRQSLATEPNHEQTLQDITVALTKKGNYDEADATLKKLAEVNPSNPSLTKLRADLEAARPSATQSTSKGK